MSIPAGLLPWVEQRFYLADGVTPNAGGSVTFSVSGTATPLDTYTTSALVTANTNPIVLDSSGRMTSCFLLPQAYRVVVKTSAAVVLYTLDGIEDVGQIYAGQLGLTLQAGSRGITSFPYTVLAADNLVTLNTTGVSTPVVNLPTAASRKQPLCLKNVGTVALAVTPNGSDSIDALSASTAYTMAAAASPKFPSIWLMSDGISNWQIVASHGVG